MTYQRQVLKESRKGAGGVYLLIRFRVSLGGAARSKAQTHAPCTVHCACVLGARLVRRGGLVRGTQAFLSLSTRRST